MAFLRFSRYGLWGAGIAVFLAAAAGFARGDIAPPPPRPSPHEHASLAEPALADVAPPPRTEANDPYGGSLRLLLSGTPQQKAVIAGVLLATLIAGGGLVVVLLNRRKVGAAVAVLVTTLLLAIVLGSLMAFAVSFFVALPIDIPRPHPRRQADLDQSPDEIPNHPGLLSRPGDDPRPRAVAQVAELGDRAILILGNNSP
jgi:hypothetical protein